VKDASDIISEFLSFDTIRSRNVVEHLDTASPDVAIGRLVHGDEN
jgi:hypothetical protein